MVLEKFYSLKISICCFLVLWLKNKPLWEIMILVLPTTKQTLWYSLALRAFLSNDYIWYQQNASAEKLILAKRTLVITVEFEKKWCLALHVRKYLSFVCVRESKRGRGRCRTSLFDPLPKFWPNIKCFERVVLVWQFFSNYCVCLGPPEAILCNFSPYARFFFF